MITESGSMSWMSPNMKMETTTGGGVKKMLGRLVSGDSAFQNKFTAEGGDGTIAFASSFPGAIKALNISAGHSMIVQKSAFLASEAGVELSMHFQKKLGSGFFGGEGFIMQKLRLMATQRSMSWAPGRRCWSAQVIWRPWRRAAPWMW